MKLTTTQMQKLVEKIFDHLKAANVIQFKVDEKIAYQRAVDAVKQEYQREIDLDREVNAMLDQLERTNSGEFQRHKMYTLLKQKLAKEKKVIL